MAKLHIIISFDDYKVSCVDYLFVNTCLSCIIFSDFPALVNNGGKQCIECCGAMKTPAMKAAGTALRLLSP